jgi:hypothetical protein
MTYLEQSSYEEMETEMKKETAKDEEKKEEKRENKKEEMYFVKDDHLHS